MPTNPGLIPASRRRSSLVDTFNMLDSNNSGFIDATELKAGLKALGQPSSNEHIALLLEAEGLMYDPNSFSIDSETFLCIIGSCNKEEKVLDKFVVMDIFRTIDLDASEYITTAELHHFLSNIGLVRSSWLCVYRDDTFFVQ
jgi:Ca2+-binding EF-hand superfamily protein